MIDFENEAMDNDDNIIDLAEVDFDVDSPEVIRRIETVISLVIDQIIAGDLPAFCLISRTSENSALVPIDPNVNDHQIIYNNNHNDNIVVDQDENEIYYKIQLQDKILKKDLLSRNSMSAYSVTRMFKMLEITHELIIKGKRATERELYYRLLNPPIFNSTHDVSEAIQDIISLLRVPRSCLGLSCSSKGAISGNIYIKFAYTNYWQDGSNVSINGITIPGDVSEIQNCEIETNAQYIIVIEKDAIFQRLTEDKIYNNISSILITGKGMPDLCTRIFLHKIIMKYPSIKIFGLVDWNPSGIAILNIYRHGSWKMGLESPKYAIPHLKWLGVRHEMLIEAPASVFQSLTERDKTLIDNIINRYGNINYNWCLELSIMKNIGHKCEIEAIYQIEKFDNLASVLIHKIMHNDFI